MELVSRCNFFEYLLKKSESHFNKNTNISVLDVGCGDKPYEKMIHQVFKDQSIDINYTGVDFYSNKADIVLDINSSQLPIPDNSIDFVICTEVLEHLHNPKFCLDEITRVTKKGGIILITTPLLSPIHHNEHDYFRITHNYFRRYFNQQNILREIYSNTFLSYFIYVTEYYIGRFFDLLSINIGSHSTRIVSIIQKPFDWITLQILGEKKFLTFSCYAAIGYLIEKPNEATH